MEDSKWEAPAVKVVKKILRQDLPIPGMSKFCIVGKGPTVGGPIIRFLKEISEVNLKICDSKTSEEALEKAVGEADLVIVGTGVAGLVKAEWLKSGAGVVDYSSPRRSRTDNNHGLDG
jgi:methylenetetrahydrofolate dehydrogenase (NADP+)/methenyltetrahydrofolate cyclohydrolase